LYVGPVAGPLQVAVLEPLVIEDEAAAIPVKGLEPVPLTAAK